MFEHSKAYSGFAVTDLDEARRFYGQTLGLPITEADTQNGVLEITIGGDRQVVMYLSADMTPASYTMLNFPVGDIERAVDTLAERGVQFERYDAFPQDEKGVVHGSGLPTVASFKDPAGNVLSVVQEA